MKIIGDFFSILEPMQVQHIAGLTLFPLKASVKHNIENIRTFDELADLGLARALEHKAGATVTSVNIENNSDHWLLLLDGEGIVGAKQNRMMQKSVIIAPRTCHAVPVNCVEQGRWSYSGSQNFEKANFAISPKMRDVKGEFLKMKADHRVQSAMWDEISLLERKLGTRSPTQDLNEIITTSHEVSSSEIRKFVQQNPCSGFLVFGSGRPFIELFGREDLCERFISKSIRSWVADVDDQQQKHSFNTYRALNHLLLSDWTEDDPVCSEKVYISRDESNGRCVLMNNEFVHGYYYLPSHSYH